MKYANLTDSTLRFTMSGVKYEVEAGGEVEIPDAFAYAVKGFGLPLVSSSEVTPVKPAAPKAEPAKVEEKPAEQPLLVADETKSKKPK